MLLDTLVSPSEAEEALQQYERQVRDERTVEDDAIRAGYRAAARGLPLVRLPDVMAAGGWFDDAPLPRLAIARANVKECWVRTTDWRTPEGTWQATFCDKSTDQGRARVGRHRVEVLIPQPSDSATRRGQVWGSGHTIVPLIPPRHRPKRTRLHLFHILWEVEAWKMAPPGDPALLRHVRGDLWSVVATWNLTELEKAVLSQRVR